MATKQKVSRGLATPSAVLRTRNSSTRRFNPSSDPDRWIALYCAGFMVCKETASSSIPLWRMPSKRALRIGGERGIQRRRSAGLDGQRNRIQQPRIVNRLAEVAQPDGIGLVQFGDQLLIEGVVHVTARSDALPARTEDAIVRAGGGQFDPENPGHGRGS